MRTLISLSAVPAYYFFHYEYFHFVRSVTSMTEPKKKQEFIYFLINISLFFICTVAQCHLMLNWFLYLLFLLVETAVFTGNRRQKTLFLSIHGIICGLCINIFSRCLIALVLNRPLYVFDNNVLQTSNLKVYPVVLGFAVSALIFRCFCREKESGNIRLILEEPGQLTFLMKLMTVMLLYLYLYLLLYSYPENHLILKLWGICSCVFVTIGYYLGLTYALRTSELIRYGNQNIQMRQLVESNKEKKDSLRSAAYRDALTGLYNRTYAQKMIEALLQYHTPFCLCFVDLNGLKTVNDQLGHSYGDDYLMEVSRELSLVCREKQDFLFRYGGDEFILVFVNADQAVARQRLTAVNQRLKLHGEHKSPPFSMSVSFGVVSSHSDSNMQQLIHQADMLMYRQKQQNYKEHKK